MSSEAFEATTVQAAAMMGGESNVGCNALLDDSETMLLVPILRTGATG